MRGSVVLLVLGVLACDPPGAKAPHGANRVEPALVVPTVPPTAVTEDLDEFGATDGDAFVRMVSAHIGTELPKEVSEEIRKPGPTETDRVRDDTVKLNGVSPAKIVYVKRHANDYRGATITFSDAGFAIPPTAWIQAVIEPLGADPAALTSWYRDMAQRLATAGRASGLILSPNGDALAVVLSVTEVPTEQDLVLSAHTQLFRAGSFDGNAWGPSVAAPGPTLGVEERGHGGVTVGDMLRRMLPNQPASSTSPQH